MSLATGCFLGTQPATARAAGQAIVRDDPKLDLMRKVGELSATEDAAGLATIIAPEFVLHEDPGIPYGGDYYGVAGLIRLHATVMRSWHESRTEVLAMMAQLNGENVSVLLRVTGKPGSSASPVTAYVTQIWSFRNGKAVEARVWYYDAPALFMAMKSADALTVMERNRTER